MQKGGWRKQAARQESICAVCHLKLLENDGQERLTCTGCASNVHRNCYSPQFQEKGKVKFKCDQCKHAGKGKDRSCLACGRGRESGMLKNVSGDEWAHVLCALASPRLKLASYKTLVFHAGKNPPQKKLAKGARCISCNYEKSPGLMCLIPDCQHYMHLNCVALSKSQETAEEYSAFLTIGLLDKHENSLLTHLKNMEQPIPFRGLDLYPLAPPELRLFVCQEHNDNDFFMWCYCGGEGQSGGTEGELKLVECVRCSRWFHTECCEAKELCSGCNNNNPYERNLTLPELVAKAIEAETASFDKVQVKFLDHFCLKLSAELQKVIEKGSYEVQRYYLRKALGETDLSDPYQVNAALEILYYLSKKQRKSKDEISPQEIEQIIKAESKLNKYEWNNKSEQRVEKRFKTKLEDLLKAIRRDGTRDVKLKLQDFIKKNESAAVRTHKEIAADLAELVKSLQASEGWKENYSAFPNRDPERHLIEFFYEMKFSQEEAISILGALRTLFNPKGRGAILESDYRAITPIFDRVLPQQKRKIFQSLFDNLTRDLCLRKAYKEKQVMRGELQSLLKLSRNGRERESIKQSILSNRLLVTSASPLLQIEKDSIELSVLRRKVIRNSQDPSPHQLPEVKVLLSKLLELDTRSQGLSPSQRRGFEQTQVRLAFYESLSTFAGEAMIPEGSNSSSMVDQNSEGIPQSEGKRIQRPIRSLTLRERAAATIMDWKWTHNEAIALALTETHKLAINSIVFEESQRELVHQFCQNTVEFFSRAIQAHQITPSGHLLERLYRVAEYSQCLPSYPILKELYEVFDEWKKDLDSIDDISIALETPQKTETLFQIVSGRIEAGDQVGGGIDLSTELRKLRAVRLWCQLSLKLHQGNRTTITAVQATKSLMDRIHYPNNCLRRRVQALQAESKSLNKRISHFLEKPKNVELETYEEEKLMAAKMTLGDGVALQRDLQGSELDVQVELQELVQEIREFKVFPKNLAALVQNQSLEELQALRRKLFQSSFRLEEEGLQLYHRLLTRITQLKCLDYEPGTQIAKKEYFKLLSSGPAGAELFTETSTLHRGYKDVERAEREFFASKQRLENLLPSDCRRVREDLKDDPSELGKVTRWHTLSEKAKERYKTLRNSRVDISQMSAVQSELQRLPLNNHNILHEITLLRRQLDDLTKKVRNFLQSSDSTMLYNSPYVMDLVTQYHSMGVRNEYLDKFQRMFNHARMIFDFAKEPIPDHYPRFHALCEDYPELAKSDELYRIRESIFDQMAALYMGSSENMMEVGCALFAEGGYLMRHANKVPKVLEVLKEVETRFNKWGQRGRAGEEEDSEEEMEADEDGEMEDEDEDEDEDQMMDDEDIDEDSYMSEESSSSHRNRKRPRPNEVVELDDD